MDNFVAWAARKGATIKLQDSWGTPATGGDSAAAFTAIRAGNPVVLGWGNYLHYNIGVGAGTVNGARYVWANNGQGHGRYDGWIRLSSTFYTGIVKSFVAGK